MNASVTRVSTATRRASQDEHCFTPRFWTGSFVLGPVAWVEAALGIWFFFYLLLSRASLTRVLAQRLYRSMKSGSLCKLSQGGGGGAFAVVNYMTINDLCSRQYPSFNFF